MGDADTVKAAWPDELTDAQVESYLHAHKDFFIKNPRILDQIKMPTQKQGSDGVIDFQSFMVERLKTDKKQVLNVQKEIIAATKENHDNLNRIHSCILALLEAQTFGEFVDIVVQDLPVLLDVDVVGLVVENFTGAIQKMPQSGIQLVHPGTVEEWLADGDAYLQSNTRGNPEIFGIGANLVRSVALVKLKFIGGKSPLGILAFGSRDPNGFHEEQGIDQIAFLGQIVERCVRAWLQLK